MIEAMPTSICKCANWVNFGLNSESFCFGVRLIQQARSLSSGWRFRGFEAMYHAKLSVVLSQCEDQALANAELERAMQELGFKRTAHHFEGKTDLESNTLLGVVSDHVLSNLRQSHATVWVSSWTPLPC
jgi:hypothetical protein